MPRVRVADVQIKEERFRDDYGDIEELAVSISRYGLLHPIIVDKELNLIAGERRLKAHRTLGLDMIDVRYVDDADELVRREIEIEENLKRKNFTWQEEVKAKSEIDRIKRGLYGDAVKGHGGGWSLRDTADSLGDSIGTVSRDLRLAKAIEQFPDLSSEKTKDAAWKRYQRMRERALVESLSDSIQVEISLDCLVHADARDALSKIKSASVDLVLTDPPYGIALDKGFKSLDAWDGKIYDDEVQTVLDTIDTVMRECFRVLKNDRHMYVFCAIQHYDYLLKKLREIGFNVGEVPCVWHKTGGAGAGGSEYAYASNYELFFLCMKGRRRLNRVGESNVFTEMRVSPQRKVHPTQKPLPLIRSLIEQSTRPGEFVIDPFAGSGTTLRAAMQLKRTTWGCEKDKNHYGAALLEIKKMIGKENAQATEDEDLEEAEEI